MDHYNTLGVNRNATPDDIKKAYRKLASQHHPDKGGDTVKFQEIQTAYDVLSDVNKRQQYDNPQPQGFPNGFHFNFGAHPNDIFGQFNEILRQRHQPLLRTRIEISLLESYHGVSKQLRIQTNNGLHPVNINVPKGINNNQQIRYENIIPNHTLIVDFVVLPDLKYDRKGNDLHSNHSIDMLELIIGTTFNFITISGKTLNVPIKPMTQPFFQLRLANQGMPILNTNNYGDQIILLKPFISDNIHSDIIYAIQKHKSNKGN
jgi:DnaJ-class molecular chaperone